VQKAWSSTNIQDGHNMHTFMGKLKTFEKVGQYTQKSDISTYKYSLFRFLHIMVIKIEIFGR
jgi:hypothetical protein